MSISSWLKSMIYPESTDQQDLIAHLQTRIKNLLDELSDANATAIKLESIIADETARVRQLEETVAERDKQIQRLSADIVGLKQQRPSFRWPFWWDY